MLIDNSTTGPRKNATWTSYNYPASVSRGSSNVTFKYGPDRQRYRETGPDYMRTTVNAYFEKVEDSDGTAYKHYIRAGSRVIAIHDRKSDYHHTTHYLHRDHLGSIDVITDQGGNVGPRMSFDAFGQRRQALNWNDGFPPPSELDEIRDITTRGYTGSQMVDDVNLVHMGGRIYDPELGRFLSPDPNVPDPHNTQAYNRYSYVYNNPLSFTDSSGFMPERDEPKEPEPSNREQFEKKKCEFGGHTCVVEKDGQGQPRAYRVSSEVSRALEQAKNDPNGNYGNALDKGIANTQAMIDFLKNNKPEDLAAMMPEAWPQDEKSSGQTNPFATNKEGVNMRLIEDRTKLYISKLEKMKVALQLERARVAGVSPYAGMGESAAAATWATAGNTVVRILGTVFGGISDINTMRSLPNSRPENQYIGPSLIPACGGGSCELYYLSR